LLVSPKGASIHAECIGGTTDISAGQLIDRTGVLLGLPFPAGKFVDELSGQSGEVKPFRVKLDGLHFSLSGMENKVKAMCEMGESKANIARFAVETVASAVRRTTDAARAQYPALPVLCSGGVASNSVLRRVMAEACFAAPEFSRDNAMGVAILARRAIDREARP
jgi:N6-L-threonylcarbamoyladenine synthase